MATMHFDPSGLQQQLEQARQKREMESLPELAGVPVRACVLFSNEKVKTELTDAQGAGRNCPVFLADDAQALIEYIQSGAPADGEGLHRAMQMLESHYGGGMTQAV